MKNRYYHVITLLLEGGDYFQASYRSMRSIPSVQEWNDFILTKAEEKHVDKNAFVIINTMTLYMPLALLK